MRLYAQDTYDEVRWSDARCVELLDVANSTVYDEVSACLEPKVGRSVTEVSQTLTAGVAEYDLPGTCKKFLRMIKRDSSSGRVTHEILPADPLSDLDGLYLMDYRRGFRVQPTPLTTETDWILQYVARGARMLHYGTAQGVTGTTLTMASSPTMGSISSSNSFYVGCYVHIVSASTGVGEIRRVVSHVGSTKVLTLDTSWGTTPTGTIVYEILPSIPYPYDMLLPWRAVMSQKAGDSDIRHRSVAEAEYKDLMRSYLTEIADQQGRVGPTIGSSFLEPEDYGDWMAWP